MNAPTPAPDPLDLLPCPFCGHPAALDCDRDRFYVECTDCSFTGNTNPNRDKVIAAWNRRAPVVPMGSPALVEAAKDVCEQWLWYLGDVNSRDRLGCAIGKLESLALAAPKGDKAPTISREGEGSDTWHCDKHDAETANGFPCAWCEEEREGVDGSPAAGSPSGGRSQIQEAVSDLDLACRLTENAGGEDILISYIRPRLEIIRSALEGATRPGEPLGEPEQEKVKCDFCHGNGGSPSGDLGCPICAGAGWVWAPVTSRLPMEVAPERPGTCQWTGDEDGDFWETDCGHAFQFNNGGPKENDQKFCGYCGKPVLEVGHEDLRAQAKAEDSEAEQGGQAHG